MNILVSGPMCSGTRLLTRLLAASGEFVEHDTQHGNTVWPTRVDAVVAITRDVAITHRSWTVGWNATGWHPDVSRVLIRFRYPGAVRVSYEELVADPQGTLDKIADALNIERFACSETVYDGNARWVA